MARRMMQFRITLKDTPPLVWRRMLVPETYTFFDLHAAIQDAMGWTDSHLHKFTVEPRGRNPVTVAIPWPETDPDGKDLDGRCTLVSDYLTLSAPVCSYLYDFGDSWEHEVRLEEIKSRAANARIPRIVDGAGACPPEDCGGTGGYEDLQEILRDPTHEEYNGMLTWLGIRRGTELDPFAFDLAAVRFKNSRRLLRRYEEEAGLSPLPVR